MRTLFASLLATTLLSACVSSPTSDLPPDTTAAEAPVADAPAVDVDVAVETPPALMRWSDLLSMERAEPTMTLRYGSDEAQIVDLWRPDGPGPHPVVLMIHGGCWQKAIADRTLMDFAAEDLRQRGMAVWNIEYRGVDEEGGGYPGTFLDVSEATRLLFETGVEHSLDLERVVAFGHSAGGHLVAWLATQSNLPEGSPLKTDLYAPMEAVIVSGGLADLEASVPVTLDTCLANIADDLTGSPSEARPNVYSDTSPAEMLPPGTVVISVNGEKDRIAPPLLGEALTEKIAETGSVAAYVEVPNAGHVELIAPGTDAFNIQAGLMEQYLNDDE